MSRLSHAEAMDLAQRASKALRPTVQRLKCVGSVRRMRPTCSDIEFLAEPHFDSGLFGERAPIIEPVAKTMAEIGTWAKGGERMMQVTDLCGRPGAKLELYLVHPPANWYVLLAIRTGPADLGRYVVTQVRSRGYRIDRGRAVTLTGGQEVPVESEKAFFALADVECRPPKERDAQAIELWNDANRYRQGVTRT